MELLKPITVTTPFLPPLGELMPYLEEIWRSKWVTNDGHFHRQLETALSSFLGVEHISLFTNGTLPLMVALRVLGIKGEVITTPYSFVATSHAICWNGLTPVFVDVDPVTGNLNPGKIEAAITPRTTAIMPVHVYGTPCDIDSIQKIAKCYGLKVIYDAAHAFGVKVKGKSVLEAGDMSVLSFHATKTYHTFEGGALISHSSEIKHQVDAMRNFGFEDEVTIGSVGINGKMDEIRAAFGLIGLKNVSNNIKCRQRVAEQYRNGLREVKGIRFMEDVQGVLHNYSYFPIFVNAEEYGASRDELYQRLRENNVLARRYFYPLISSFSPYCNLPSARQEGLIEANSLANSVICLPISHELTTSDVERVLSVIK